MAVVAVRSTAMADAMTRLAVTIETVVGFSQVSHLNEGLMSSQLTIKGAQKREWAAHQILTCCDYNTDSMLWRTPRWRVLRAIPISRNAGWAPCERKPLVHSALWNFFWWCESIRTCPWPRMEFGRWMPTIGVRWTEKSQIWPGHIRMHRKSAARKPSESVRCVRSSKRCAQAAEY